MDCDGTADGETYSRLRSCIEAPTFNILSNNNRQATQYCDRQRAFYSCGRVNMVRSA